MKMDALFRWAALVWATLGYALLAMDPAIAVEGFGNHRVPVFVHAFTLGVFVNGYYALQGRVWQRLYGTATWAWMALVVWAIHQAGVALMLWGFLRAGLPIALVGAHYLVPTGIVLHAVHAGVTTRRRAPRMPRQLGAHTPTLGLLVTMGLGAMIILDETTGRYHLFNPPTLLVHGLAGALLFLFPLLRLVEELARIGPGDESTDARVAAGALIRTVPLAVGLLILVTSLGGSGIGAAVGLVMMGAITVWVALPGVKEVRAQPAALFRGAWVVPGALLLFAAIRTLRGFPAQEAFPLASVGALSVILLAGAPEVLMRLWTKTEPGWRNWLPAWVLLGAGVLALLGQVIGSGELVHSAAVLGTATCLWIGWQARGRLG